MTAVYHSSESDTWLTPQVIADALGEVALDPCAHPRSLVRAALRAHGPDVDGIDGLDLPWHEAAGVVFVNPPYSELRAWINKCRSESALGACVVALVPARVDTRAFHDHVLGQARILCVEGRLRFAVPQEEIERKAAAKPSPRLERMLCACVDGVCHSTDSAPFPCALVHWQAPGSPEADAIEAALAHLGKWIG